MARKGEHISEEQKAKVRAKLLGHKSFGGTFEKGHPPLQGIEKGWFKKGIENPNWKGGHAGYRAYHTWVTYYRGAPKKCEHCGTTKARQFDWASKSHEYKRDLKDWIRLCPKCHQEYDKNFRGVKRKIFGK